jgi:phosphoribosyl-dephospho-CoA transferase
MTSLKTVNKKQVCNVVFINVISLIQLGFSTSDWQKVQLNIDLLKQGHEYYWWLEIMKSRVWLKVGEINLEEWF